MQFAPRIELSRKYCFNEMIFNFNSKLLCPCPYCRYVRRFSKRFRMRKNAHHLHNHSNMEGLIHLTIMFFVRAFMVFQTFCAWMQRSWFAKCKLNCFRKIVQKENGDECLKEGERERGKWQSVQLFAIQIQFFCFWSYYPFVLPPIFWNKPQKFSLLSSI